MRNRKAGRVLGLLLQALVLLTVIGVGVATTGCDVTDDDRPLTTSCTVVPFTVLTTPKTEASTTTVVSPTTEAGSPVLLELPELPLDQLALIEVRTWHYTDDGKTVVALPGVPGIRILSPTGDADPVNSLLSQYESIELRPSEGFPQPGNLSARAVFRLKDGSSIEVLVEDGTNKLVVAFEGKGLAPEGWNTPHAFGCSSSFARTVAGIGDEAAREFPSGFTLPLAMPDDFSLTFAYGVRLRNVLDTASGLFTKDLGSERTGTVTADVALSEEALASLYTGLRRLDIGKYASVFQPDSTAGRGHVPFVSYYLHVRANGHEKEIVWEDKNDSTALDAVALRAFFGQIQALLRTAVSMESL
jgi:hypothetical protein